MPPKQKKDTKTKQKEEEVVEKEQKKKGKADKMVKEQKGQKQIEAVNEKGEKVEMKQTKLKIELGDGVFPNKEVRISSWNINGLRASTKHDSTNNYLSADKFDVICFNELKVDENNYIKENLHTKFPKNYHHYLNFCKEKSGYSGVAIISKVKPISVKFDIGVPKHDKEGRTLTLEYDKFNLVACYVPNAGEKLVRLDYRTKEWDIDFQKYLAELKKKKPTILCGDLNVAHEEIDIANPKTNQKSAGFTPEERKGFTNFLGQGWIDSFRHLHPKEVKYSYFSARFQARQNNKGWRLDYFVINQESIGAVFESEINTAIEGSDHVPIELLLDTSKL